MRAEELCPAGADYVDLDDANVRKGTVAAFTQNALTLERTDPASEEYERAFADLRATVPVLAGAGFFEVFAIRPQVARTASEYIASAVLARG